MKNPRITQKERGLLKGAMRRVFSRSELRQQVLAAAEVKHFDPKRPRVKKWVRCAACGELTPKYLAAADHVNPIIPVTSSMEEMSLDEVADRMWCEKNNLQVLDESCHNAKTKAENKLRRQHKKEKKVNVKQRN